MIKLFKKTLDLQDYLNQYPQKSCLVPTMGNLHRGHLNLITESLKAANRIIVSIFVNPTQFAANEDFNHYPRTLDEDISKINQMFNDLQSEQEILIFAPESSLEIYPKNFKLKISVEGIKTELEGLIRPTHFDGVCTVVYRLFSLIKPDYAIFGKKDYQQLVIIQKMVQDMLLPIQILSGETTRSESGLALSSRNQYLSSEQKDQAHILSSTLNDLKIMLEEKGISIEQFQIKISEIRNHDQNWDYLELRNANDLSHQKLNSHLVILGAYRLGNTRLLDNCEVNLK